MQQAETAGHPSSTARMAHVEIEGLVVDMQIGHLGTEQGRIQRVSFSAQVGFDDQRTHLDDSGSALLDRGMDPGAVREAIINSCKTPVVLMETLANRIAHAVFALPAAETLALKITKSHTWADTEKVSLLIHRIRGDFAG